MSVFSSPFNEPFHNPFGSPFNAPGVGGWGYVSIMGDTLAPYVTFTRASTATYFDSAGVMQTAGINEPRYDYGPDTLAYRGLLVEEQRTNLLLNSATLSTQSVTVAAVTHTLSFYGTGTVTLSGVSTAGPLVGTGASDRVTLSFTPTAGSLTLTVTGTCTLGQLEAGSFATSYIPTTSAAVTRAADVAVVSDLTDIGYNASEGTIYAEVSPAGWSSGTTGSDRMICGIDSGASSLHGLLRGTGNSIQFHDSTAYRTLPNPTWNDGAVRRVAFATSNTVTSSGAVNGTAGSVTTDTSVMDGSATKLTLGRRHSAAGLELCGHIKTLRYYPRRLSNAELQELTA